MKKPQTTAGEGLVRQLERFLTALVNVRWEKGDEQAENDAQEIARMYRNYFPAGFVSVTPEDLTARNLQEKAIEDEFAAVGPELTVEDVRSERLQKIWVLTSMLRRVWKEQDLDAKDWHIFNARHFYNGTRNPEPPERNLFDQAMRHLQRHAARARFCSNPDCPSPYYLSRDFRLRTFCSSICAGPAKREAKRHWWNQHRSVTATTRRQSKSPKLSESKSRH